MAEVVGTAAAAIQLAETALKLKKLCADIRDAPKDVLDLAEEVTVLADLLADVRNVQMATADTTTDSNNWKRCYQLFKSSADSLNHLVVDLDNMMKKHRRTGSIRVYLKKDELSRYKQRLERIKSVMSLAQQSYSLSILSQQNSLVLREIQAVAAHQHQCQSSSSQNVLTIQSVPALNQSTSDCAQHSDRSVKRSTVKRTQRNSRYNLRLPRWILNKGIQILVQRSNNSWGIHFRIYNQVSSKSPVFSTAKRGDWLAVKQMFCDGCSSPFDVNPDGLTLLHFAASRLDPDGCRMLLEYGCDPSWKLGEFGEDALGSALLRLIGRQAAREISDRTIETLSLLSSNYPNKIMPQDPDFRKPHSIWYLRFLVFVSGPAISTVTKNLVQLEDIEPIQRAELMTETWSPHPEALSIVLGPQLDFEKAFALLSAQKSKFNHTDLLVSATSSVAMRLASMPHGEIEDYQPDHTISAIIEFERRHPSNAYWSSYLSWFFECYLELPLSNKWRNFSCSDWNEMVTQVGRRWLAYLASQGADLARYGAFEKACLQNFGPFSIEYPGLSKKKTRSCGIKYLTTGPKPSDWNLWVVPDTSWERSSHTSSKKTRVGHKEYEMAGDFWKWIEEPEMFGVPGTFFEDDCDSDDRQFDHHSQFQFSGPIF